MRKSGHSGFTRFGAPKRVLAGTDHTGNGGNLAAEHVPHMRKQC